MMNETIRDNSGSLGKQKRSFNIIVIGDSNVGKTCLTFRFCGGKFPSRTQVTMLVDYFQKQVEIEGEVLKLQLWDTGATERFGKSIIPQYYRNAHAAVFVYDVTKMSSFNNLSHWIAEFEQHNQMNQNDKVDVIPKILVGNKCDCTGEIAVSTKMATKFADSHNMKLFETSAQDDSKVDHVDAIFMTLAHKLKNSKPTMTGTVPRNESTIILKEKDDENKDSFFNC